MIGATPGSLEELVKRYYQAYNEHDLDGILSLQTPDCEYRLHGAQETRSFTGVDACREVYAHHLRAWPDQRLTIDSAVVDGDLCVCHVSLTGTLTARWTMAGRTYEPIGKPITFELLHIMRCADNLVRIKDGWIDGLAIHNQLTAGGA